MLLVDVDINCYMSRHDQTAQLSYCIKLEKQVGDCKSVVCMSNKT